MLKTSFDTIIGPGTLLTGGVVIAPGTTVVFGSIQGGFVRSDVNENARLHVHGKIDVEDDIIVRDLVIQTGAVVKARKVYVEGTITIVGRGELHADEVLYRALNLQPGCLLTGRLIHLDLSSAGEIV